MMVLQSGRFGGGGGGNPYGLVGVSSPMAITENSGTLDLVIPYPSGIAANDIAIVHIVCVEGGSPATITVPSGWSMELDAGLGGAYTHAMLWKRLVGTESGNLNVSINIGLAAQSIRLGFMSVWGGCDTTGNPFWSRQNNEGTSTSAIASSVDSYQPNWFVVNLIGTDKNNLTTPPSGYTEGYDEGTILGYDGSLAMNYKQYSSSGPTGSQTTTFGTSGRWGVISFALIKNGETPPAPTTSYANSGGTGARTGIITSSNTGIDFGLGSSANLIDGSLANNCYFSNRTNSGQTINFDFGVTKIIDEFIWYQDNGTTHGTWAFEASNDNVSWTAIGSNFTLGPGTFTRTNTTAYRYYRLRAVSGTRSSSPYIREIEFKISS